MFVKFNIPYLVNEVQFEVNQVQKVDDEIAQIYIKHAIAEKATEPKKSTKSKATETKE